MSPRGEALHELAQVSAAVIAPGNRITATWRIVGQSTAKTKLEVRVHAPGGGASFDPTDGPFYEEFVGPYSTRTSASIDIPQPETLQLIAEFSTYGDGGPLTTGRFRFTLTFKPN